MIGSYPDLPKHSIRIRPSIKRLFAFHVYRYIRFNIEKMLSRIWEETKCIIIVIYFFGRGGSDSNNTETAIYIGSSDTVFSRWKVGCDRIIGDIWVPLVINIAESASRCVNTRVTLRGLSQLRVKNNHFLRNSLFFSYNMANVLYNK
jgi:hypothetical protein